MMTGINDFSHEGIHVNERIHSNGSERDAV